MPGAHVHSEQEDRFEVLSGTMAFPAGPAQGHRGPGETVVVPAGTHRFHNVGHEPARVLVEVRPALQMERLFETVVSLALQGRCLPSGMPRPLDLALFVREFRREMRAPFPPPFAVRAALAPLVWMAERRGRALTPAYGF